MEAVCVCAVVAAGGGGEAEFDGRLPKDCNRFPKGFGELNGDSCPSVVELGGGCERFLLLTVCQG
jgi:hypothetical protein